MKYLNSIYILGLCMLGAIWYLTNQFTVESNVFYGFAENKEMEIKHPIDIKVKKIHVNVGQKVVAGQELIELINPEIPTNIEVLKLEKENITLDAYQKAMDLQSKISELEYKSTLSIMDINEDIYKLEESRRSRDALYDGLAILSKPADGYDNIELEINLLKDKIQKIKARNDEEVAALNKIIKQLEKPIDIQKSIIDKELDQNYKTEEDLVIRANNDGVIGTISCKEGEEISSYTTLINLYEKYPTQVKGYVHESMAVNINIGDEITVESTLRPDEATKGTVIGLGSRIVEIPERLRKIREFKTFGREVIIEIPKDNELLQKEKVILKHAIFH